MRLVAVFVAILVAPSPVRGADPAKPSDSIQGIRIGSELDRIEEILEPYGPSPSDGGEEEKEDDHEEKQREVWSLARGDYETIVVEADTRGKVTGVTGFLRKGREIPFERLGREAGAARWTDSIAIWNVATARGGYRLLARGPARRAQVVTLLSLALPPGS
jgi:hypothetical protein